MKAFRIKVPKSWIDILKKLNKSKTLEIELPVPFQERISFLRRLKALERQGLIRLFVDNKKNKVYIRANYKYIIGKEENNGKFLRVYLLRIP